MILIARDAFLNYALTSKHQTLPILEWWKDFLLLFGFQVVYNLFITFITQHVRKLHCLRDFYWLSTNFNITSNWLKLRKLLSNDLHLGENSIDFLIKFGLRLLVEINLVGWISIICYIYIKLYFAIHHHDDKSCEFRVNKCMHDLLIFDFNTQLGKNNIYHHRIHNFTFDDLLF